MTVLQDTHVFLWFILNDKLLSAEARRLITAGSNRCHLSIASVWEMAIKVSTGKLGSLSPSRPFDVEVCDQLTRNRIELLPIDLSHVLRVASLPFHHRDPFDRLLIAQSLTEGIPPLSADSTFDAYSVQRIW